MKKLIVFSVIFALVAGSVFAADVSAAVIGTATILQGNDVKENKADPGKDPDYQNKNKNQASYGIGRARLSASAALEDGTVGGDVRYDAGGSAAGWVWWKPVDAFKLQIGTNPDGEFGLDGVTRWGFYQLAGDSGIISPGNAWGGSYTGLDDNFGNAFYGGWGGALMLTITPIEALAINLGFPLGSQDAAYKDYLKFTAQVKYNIEGVGTVGLTYQNGLGHDDGKIQDVRLGKLKDPAPKPAAAVPGLPVYDEEGKLIGTTNGTDGATLKPEDYLDLDPITYKAYLGETNDPSKLWIYFGLSAIENLGIDIGVGLTLPSDVSEMRLYDPSDDKKVMGSTTVTHNYPISAGIGVNFSSGALGVKARVLGTFGESTTTELKSGDKTVSTTVGEGFSMLIDVQPSFAVNETLTAYLSLGTGFKTGWDVLDKYDDKGNPVYKSETRSLFAWHVQPYVVITPSYWSGAFFAGFRLESPIDRQNLPGKDGKENWERIVNWSIPIGIVFSF